MNLMRSPVRLLAAGLLLVGSLAAAQPRSRAIAIIGADVLPMNGTAELADQTVIVRGDRIEAIGPHARVVVPIDARRIQARGLTLLPGLADMHVHLPKQPGHPGDETQRALALMLAHGITTARVMQASDPILDARAAIERGKLPGPRLYVASPPINDDNTRTAEEARDAVRRAARMQYDLVKSHQISNLAVWTAVQNEARRQGLPTAGHVDNKVGLDRALAAGEEVEHLDGSILEFLPTGSKLRSEEFAQVPSPEVIDAVSRVTDRAISALAKRVAASKLYQGPTLASFEQLLSPDSTSCNLLHDPQMQFVSAATARQWADTRAQLALGFRPEQARAFLMLRRRIVAAFARAGVPLLAGSDTPHPFQYWGSGMIREIEALHASGLSSVDALLAATVAPRDYFRSLVNGGSALGWHADFGTVEIGARADLLLVRGDPSRNLSALRDVRAVIAGGRLYDRSRLDRILKAVKVAKASLPCGRQQRSARPSL
jgi:imidazolonepropionase-like amidohydrolase